MSAGGGRPGRRRSRPRNRSRSSPRTARPPGSGGLRFHGSGMIRGDAARRCPRRFRSTVGTGDVDADSFDVSGIRLGAARKYDQRHNRIDRSQEKFGRSERIRTSDPIVPNDVRYQAALHSDIAALSGPRARLIGARRARRKRHFARPIAAAAKARRRLARSLARRLRLRLRERPGSGGARPRAAAGASSPTLVQEERP
jgi:hypothetical protein